MNQVRYLKKCLELIEEKLNWGSSSEWTNVKFEILSDRIREAAGDSPSVKTLKRLFGRAATYKEEYIPQQATKQALARFLGFRTWEDFTAGTFLPEEDPSVGWEPAREERPAEAGLTEADLSAASVITGSPSPAAKRTWLFRMMLLTGVAGIALVILLLTAPISAFSPDIACAVTTGDQPGQVNFTYDLSALKTDSIYLAWEEDYLPLHKQQHTASYTFTMPGFYRIGLFAGGRKIAHAGNVHALSSGWVTLMSGKLYPGTFRHPGILYAAPKEVRASGVSFKDYWVEYRNFRSFEASADHVTFEARVKNSAADGGIDCYDTELEIVGEKGKIRAVFLKPGCQWHGKLDLGEIHLRGDSTDLSALCTDLSAWRTIRIAVKNKKAQILIDHKLVYQLAYQVPVGRIKGIICRFKGSGTVDNIFMVNERNKVVYSEGFGD